MRMKRIALVLAAAGLVVGTAGPASAGGSHGPRHGGTVVTTPVSWTITNASCSKVPPGAAITGSGTLTDIINEHNDDGVTAVRVDSHATGIAQDQDGNAYTWTYDLRLRSKNTVAAPDVYTGVAVDSFRMSGEGPLRLRNGFVARIVDDRLAGTFAINPISSHGDPFDFPYGPNRCDPL